jgi:hypothetical protein
LTLGQDRERGFFLEWSDVETYVHFVLGIEVLALPFMAEPNKKAGAGTVSAARAP